MIVYLCVSRANGVQSLCIPRFGCDRLYDYIVMNTDIELQLKVVLNSTFGTLFIVSFTHLHIIVDISNC